MKGSLQQNLRLKKKTPTKKPPRISEGIYNEKAVSSQSLDRAWPDTDQERCILIISLKHKIQYKH